MSKTSLTTIVDHGESISTRFRRYRLILTQSIVMKSTNVQCLNSFKHMGKSIKIKFRRYRRKVHQIFFISDSNVYVYQYDILDVDLNRDYRSSFMSLKVCFYLFTYNL